MLHVVWFDFEIMSQCIHSLLFAGKCRVNIVNL